MNWMIGTSIYASPAFIHAAVGSRTPVNLAKADSYSVGATLFEILTGRAALPTGQHESFPNYSRHFRRRVRKCSTYRPAALSQGGACDKHTMQIKPEASLFQWTARWYTGSNSYTVVSKHTARRLLVTYDICKAVVCSQGAHASTLHA